MRKMELEVKILNIDEKEIMDKIEKLGGTFVDSYNQYLYVYDMPTLYGRFIDILLQLQDCESKVRYDTAISKLKLWSFEIDNVLSEQEKQDLYMITKTKSFLEIADKDNFMEILNKQETLDFIGRFHNNPKKWIRLRKTKNVTTLAIKHVLADNGTNIQQMQETEMEVPSMQETNQLLEALGYAYRSYQEKKRTTYLLEGHEIDIDTWPGIPTYMELEGTDEEDLSKILALLGYTMADTISCTSDQVYALNGKNMLEMREIKF